jgi:lipopolysaccharide transport system permease protein
LHLSSIFYIWLPLLVEMFLAAGLIIIFATLNTFFRDISQAVPVALSTLFFLTPIVYPVDIIPERLLWIFRLNPFYWLVESFRVIIIRGDPAGIKLLVFPFILAIFSSVLGYLLFLRTEEAIKDIL